jgi:hypothetical protein
MKRGPRGLDLSHLGGRWRRECDGNLCPLAWTGREQNRLKRKDGQAVDPCCNAGRSFLWHRMTVDSVNQRSVEANAEDWKAAPDYDYFERDVQQAGEPRAMKYT